MDELFFSGYCRAMDSSRTVTAEAFDGKWEADCAWPECPFADSCPIAKQIEALHKDGLS